MRLIHTTDLRFKEFHDNRILPEYAILSHCWSENAEDEVSYQVFRSQSYDEGSYGWREIWECCRIARERDFQWAWIDTCCINKESSAELTEAINSMFVWYKLAKVCYVFLPDVEADPRQPFVAPCTSNPTLEANSDTPASSFMVSFVASRWFTRGWTLQELLAPPYVEFFNTHFSSVGSRQALGIPIEHITGIEIKYLLDVDKIYSASIAKRMFWAAR